MDLHQAKCPKCREAAFQPVYGHPRYAQSFSCGHCGGLWVEAAGLSKAVAETLQGAAPESATVDSAATPPLDTPPLDTASDARAGLCPEGHGLLIRARLELEPGFYLDRCMECNGLWFDRGEWERVAAASLAGGLFEIWSLDFQRTQRRERSAERQERELAERLGPELLAEVRDLGARLAAHPFGNQAMAELLAVVRDG